jgi:small-conductance mechanosensitive channel
MDTSILSEPILPWTIALAVGFPLLMVALGELSALGRRRGWPAAGVVSGVRVLVVPTLALILFLRYILGLPEDNTVVQLVKTVLWIAVLYQGLSFVNHVLFGSAPEGSWQARVPSLVRDLVRFAVVGIGAAFIYSEVWGKEIGTAWAALGLGSVVIGLALQEPLGNTVSGLILLAERPLAVGDWITVDGVTGRVVEINWRSVRLQTTSLELKIVPNSALYKGSFSNLSRPTLERAGGVELSFAYEVPPNRGRCWSSPPPPCNCCWKLRRGWCGRWGMCWKAAARSCRGSGERRRWWPSATPPEPWRHPRPLSSCLTQPFGPRRLRHQSPDESGSASRPTQQP